MKDEIKGDVTSLPSVRDDAGCRRLLSLEPDRIDCIPLIGEARFLRRYRDIGAHVHAGCIEITLCIRGNLTYECNGKKYPFRTGDVFVVGAGKRHRPLSYPKGLHRYRLLFRLPSGKTPVLGLPKDESACLVRDLVALGVRRFVDRGGVQNGFRRVFEILGEKIRNPSRRRLLLRTAVLNLLLAVLSEACAPDPVLPEARIRQLADEIRANPERIYEIDEIANGLGISPSTLQSRFRRILGMPPYAYQLECRMEKAKRALSAGQSVASVANFLGYASPKHFAVQFRRHVGCPPSRFKA